jgi:GT2 family glycosyltransferase
MTNVDIIIPCYRYGHFLRECVFSALTQAEVNVRILIIDDASPDNTPEVARELAERDARVTYRRHATNQGHIATYNEGIAWVKAPYYLLLSADDYLLPDALRRAAAALEGCTQASFCFGNVLERDADGTISAVPPANGLTSTQETVVIEGSEFVEMCRRMGCNNFVFTPTALVRTSVQQRTSAYDPALPHSGDLELWLRLAALGPVCFVAKEQAVYRRHGHNMSSNYQKGARWLLDLEQRRDAIEKFCAACDGTPIDGRSTRRGLRSALAKDALSLASRVFNEGAVDASRSLRTFALTVSPLVALSPLASMLALKHLVGHRFVTQRLLPIAASFRRLRFTSER